MYLPRYFFFLIFISSTILSQNNMQNNPQKNKAYCITVPKSGTHLFKKCITLFEQEGLAPNYIHNPKNLQQRMLDKYERLNQFDPPNHYKGYYHIPTHGNITPALHYFAQHKNKRFWTEHWSYTKEREDFINKYTYANFFILRDPRDQIISMAHMIKDGRKNNQHANVENIIFDLIDGRKKHFVRWGVELHEAYPIQWELGVTEFYKLYLPWMKAKNFYTIKFENLVGPQGGGSGDAQIQEIKNIAQHLNLKVNNQKITQVAQELFGQSGTFREGQIGGWKKCFTPEMKIAYKKVPGATQLLIDLGYEKDANW